MSGFFKKLNKIISTESKKKIIFLVFLSIFIALIETVGIAAIMPFISLATDFSLIHSNEYYNKLYIFLDFDNEAKFIITFGCVLFLFYILRAFINLSYVYILNTFTRGLYHKIAYRLFEKYMNLKYKEFVFRNSSIMNKAIITETANLTALLSALLLMLSEIFVVLFIYIMMLYINYKITIALTVFLVLNAILMLKIVSPKIKKVGADRAEIQKGFYEVLNRSFANYKILKLKSNNSSLSDFEIFSKNFAKANIINATISQVPRLFLESVSFSIVIFIIIYFVWKDGNDISNILSVISMFVLSLYRLMPSINRIMSSYNVILFNHKSFEIVHNELITECEDLGNKEIEFNKNIIINDLSFEYEKDKPILKKINLNIKKGSKIAFIGKSGSGKSTLVDIIIGLHRPTSGTIISDSDIIDNSNLAQWRKKVGYIPQSVYLFDGTVGENIAFSSIYDKQRVDECLKKARIYDFLNTKKGDKTFVGEGGVMLSGGQKQRIAIARALYLDPEIIVLDEATSALDNKTEEQIMDEIYNVSKDKTLIIIAHRLSTIDRCEKIYKLENGEMIDE